MFISEHCTRAYTVCAALRFSCERAGYFIVITERKLTSERWQKRRIIRAYSEHFLSSKHECRLVNVLFSDGHSRLKTIELLNGCLENCDFLFGVFFFSKEGRGRVNFKILTVFLKAIF